MAMASTGGPLLYRIQRLMGAAGPEFRASRLPAILAACVGLGCLALNVHWAKAQEQTQAKPAEQGTVTVTTRDGQKNVTFRLFPRNGALDGRGVQVDTGGATVLKREPIEYPGPAIEKNIQGTVTVEAILDASGEVSDAHVLAGPQELRKAALRSVLGWRFQADPAGAGAARQVNITFQIPAGGFPKEPEGLQGVVLRGPNAGAVRLVARKQGAETVSFLESEVAKFKQQYQGQMAAGNSPELEAQYDDLLRKLKIAKAGVEEAQRRLVVGDGAAALAGRTVKSINMRGLSDERRAELMARLPVHDGDSLTAESVHKLEAAALQFDEHMAVGYTLTEGNTVEIHLVYTQGEPGVPIRK